MNPKRAVSKEASAQERCTKQFALNADRNAKFLSSRQKADLYTAKNVIRKKDDSKKSYF